jgi:hypothetical protein
MGGGGWWKAKRGGEQKSVFVWEYFYLRRRLAGHERTDYGLLI